MPYKCRCGGSLSTHLGRPVKVRSEGCEVDEHEHRHEHKSHEDCMTCSECGGCDESCDDDGVCAQCREALL